MPPIVQANGVLTLLGRELPTSRSPSFSSGQTICAAGSILLGSGYNSNGSNPAISSPAFTAQQHRERRGRPPHVPQPQNNGDRDLQLPQ